MSGQLPFKVMAFFYCCQLSAGAGGQRSPPKRDSSRESGNFYIILSAIVGSRLLFVITNYPYYLDTP